MRKSTLKQAFVGIRDDESKIWKLLLQCGAESVSEIASQKPAVCDVSFNFKPDEREPMSKEEYQALISIFWNFHTEIPKNFILSSGLPDNLFDYFFEQAAASNKRIPSQFLYSFERGVRRLNISTRLVSILCGRPGIWLSENSATDSIRKFPLTIRPSEPFDSTPDVVALLSAWNDFTDEERVTLFEYTHRWNPALAFEIMRLVRKKRKASEIKSYLESIVDSLSEKDVDYLQEDNKKSDWIQTRYCSTKSITSDFLARIPSSDYARQALETAKTLLTNPSETDNWGDENGQKYGRFHTSTISDAFLKLGSVPLERWEEIMSSSPMKIRARLLERKCFELFSLAQLRSFALFGASDEWFEVCCDSFLDLCEAPRNNPYKPEWYSFASEEWRIDNLENPFVKKALASGRGEYFARLLSLWNEKIRMFATYDDFKFKLLKSAFRFCPYPWNDELARIFCDVLARSISSGEKKISENAAKLLLPTLSFCSRSIQEERRELATIGTDDFKQSEAEVHAYLEACACRERFDKLFGTPKKG